MLFQARPARSQACSPLDDERRLVLGSACSDSARFPLGDHAKSEQRAASHQPQTGYRVDRQPVTSPPLTRPYPRLATAAPSPNPAGRPTPATAVGRSRPSFVTRRTSCRLGAVNSGVKEARGRAQISHFWPSLGRLDGLGAGDSGAAASRGLVLLGAQHLRWVKPRGGPARPERDRVGYDDHRGHHDQHQPDRRDGRQPGYPGHGRTAASSTGPPRRPAAGRPAARARSSVVTCQAVIALTCRRNIPRALKMAKSRRRCCHRRR